MPTMRAHGPSRTPRDGAAAAPQPINPHLDGAEVRVPIESRRYRGAPIGWDGVVGHQPQVRDCPEIVSPWRPERR